MTVEIARTLCPVTAPNGDQFVFFNSEIISKGRVDYMEEGRLNPKYSLIFNSQETTKRYRALHYSRYYMNSSINSTPRLVPFSASAEEAGSAEVLAQTSGETTYVTPIYEAISPSSTSIPGYPGVCIAYWSNLNNKFDNTNGIYKYDRQRIMRLECDKLDLYDLETSGVKALCAAVIDWEQLKATGGVVVDTIPISTPVVKKICVLSMETGNMVADFSNGSGSMKIHNHSDNSNGGFAYAVFAPGTSIQPINWR